MSNYNELNEPPYWIQKTWLYHTRRRAPDWSTGSCVEAARPHQKSYTSSAIPPSRVKLMYFHVSIVPLFECLHLLPERGGGEQPVHLAVVALRACGGGWSLPGASVDKGVRQDFLRRDPLRPVYCQHGLHKLNALLALRYVGVLIVLQKELGQRKKTIHWALWGSRCAVKGWGETLTSFSWSTDWKENPWSGLLLIKSWK